MAFDPTLPADHSPNSSAEMRGQLTALNDKIDAQAAQIVALQAALAATAHKPDLGLLFIAFDDPPTRAQAEAVVSQLNTLLNLLTVP